MDYLETDLVETTAHLGARNVDGPNGWENHAAWQGKVYRWKGHGRHEKKPISNEENTENIDIPPKSAIIKENAADSGESIVQTIGKIDVEKYKCVTPDIASDEVIITDERIAHIHERHPGDYEIVRPFLQGAITEPDYILEDKRKNTGLILKRIDKNDLRIQIVLRIHTSNDLEGYKNSILSAWCIGEDRWKNYINNKNILYKKE